MNKIINKDNMYINSALYFPSMMLFSEYYLYFIGSIVVLFALIIFDPIFINLRTYVKGASKYIAILIFVGLFLAILSITYPKYHDILVIIFAFFLTVYAWIMIKRIEIINNKI